MKFDALYGFNILKQSDLEMFVTANASQIISQKVALFLLVTAFAKTVQIIGRLAVLLSPIQ